MYSIIKGYVSTYKLFKRSDIFSKGISQKILLVYKLFKKTVRLRGHRDRMVSASDL